jgi:hypothetical protein
VSRKPKKIGVLSASLAILLLALGTPSVFASNLAPSASPAALSLGRFGGDGGAVNPLTTGVKTICTTGSEIPTGIYPGPSNGVFVEDSNTGDLLWCGMVEPIIIATPPAGGAGSGYYTGMAGVKTSLGLVLVLDSIVSPTGMWFCEGATPSGCSIQSTFITFPSAFCASQPTGVCHPNGIALDGKLNIYYADGMNADVVKCTYASAYQSCTVLEYLTGFAPVGIFRTSSGDLWVSDVSCSGEVWKNGVVQFTVFEALDSITISSSNPSKSPHVYVGVSGLCTSTAAHIQDLTDGKPLPTPLTGPTDLYGLTTKLQFTAGNNAVYFVKDSS